MISSNPKRVNILIITLLKALPLGKKEELLIKSLKVKTNIAILIK
jgi:hypothetical protein